MLSSFTGLNTSKTGLMVHQKNLYTTGHNISNADTPGYSRQSVQTVTMGSLQHYGSYHPYQIGTGVDVQSITRTRDFLTDRQLWTQNATSANFANLNAIQTKIENVFQEPSDNNVQAILDKFWTTLANVAAKPSDAATRTTMRQAAVDLVDMIKSCTKELTEEVEFINDTINKSVIRINEINKEILSLNKQISIVESTGSMANDLRDSRDLLVDELSQFANVKVNEGETGAYTVSMNGITVVTGVSMTSVEAYENKNTELFKRYGMQTLSVRTATNPPFNIAFEDGSMAGLIEGRDSNRQGVLAYMDMLNDISKALLTDFNQVHREGMGLDNSTGLNFFGALNIQYADLPPVTNPIPNPPVIIPGTTGFDPTTVPGVPNAEKNWIHHLKVNDIYFDPINGLNKIAAKTLAGNVEINLSTPTRISTITPNAGLPNASFVGQATMVYKGPSAVNVQIRDFTIVNGFVTSAEYSFDGATWFPADCTNETGQSRLVLKGPAPYDHNIEIAIDKDTANAIPQNNMVASYNMTLFPTTGGEARLTNTPFIQYDSRNQYPFELEIPAGGLNALGEVTNLSVTAGGTAATTVTVTPTGTGSNIRIEGFTPDGEAYDVTLFIAADLGNTEGDIYKFGLPPGDAASDNATRLAQFSKHGADDESVTKYSKYMGAPGYNPALGEYSINQEYNNDMANLATQVQTSYSMYANQATLVKQLTILRSNYKDVNLDEELTNMIQFQKGYTSNARMLTTIDEMLDKLINGTGRVGL